MGAGDMSQSFGALLPRVCHHPSCLAAHHRSLCLRSTDLFPLFTVSHRWQRNARLASAQGRWLFTQCLTSPITRQTSREHVAGTMRMWQRMAAAGGGRQCCHQQGWRSWRPFLGNDIDNEQCSLVLQAAGPSTNTWWTPVATNCTLTRWECGAMRVDEC